MEISLIDTWRQMIENLYNAAKEKIESELADGEGLCDTAVIRNEVDYIDSLNALCEGLDEFCENSIDYWDLRDYTEFIKKDEGSSDAFKETLEAMFEFEDAENIEENIDSIVSVVFG